MISDKINEMSPWEDLTEGNKLFGSATAREFKTGEWRTQTPVHDKEACKECYLCVPVCPDMSILVMEDESVEFDMDHCKGCGICANVCPFNAIKMGYHARTAHEMGV